MSYSRLAACRKRGHPFTPENTYVLGNGSRTCRTCKALAWEAHQPRRAAAREYVDGLRKTTTCAACGQPMRDWHNPEHVHSPHQRIANMVTHGVPISEITAEIAVCIPLCRACHMREDGRLEQLQKTQFLKRTAP